MLYLDSSALIKGYVQEKGSHELRTRVQRATETKDPVLTSLFSYAEIHAVLGRKLKEKNILAADYHFAVTRFESDWRTYFGIVEVSQRVLNFVPDLTKRDRYPLRGADAVHLASALWVEQSTHRRGMQKSAQRAVVFATSDGQLAAAAEYEQFEVFNPEIP